jgi:hypothetical protein
MAGAEEGSTTTLLDGSPQSYGSFPSRDRPACEITSGGFISSEKFTEAKRRSMLLKSHHEFIIATGVDPKETRGGSEE